jgi:hypothetical protein
MKSHFTLNGGVAVACAVAGASTMMMNSNCSAGTFIVADYATNSTYNAGWSAGQNGGYGLGAWSFDGSVSGMTNNIYTNGIPNPGAQQTMSSGSAIGTAWTLFNVATNPISGGPGLSDVGRAIPEAGGLQPGQTFHTVIQNPTAYHYYGGFDILFYNGTNNLPAGDNVAALRLSVFNYVVSHWTINDTGRTPVPSLTSTVTGAAGMAIDLTLTSPTNYSLTMTPLGNPTAAYAQTGTLVTTNLPINWVNYRLWNGQSSGPNDTAENFEISSMTIQGLMLNIQLVGTNTVLSWPTNALGVSLASSLNLGVGAAWSTNGLPSPVVTNGLNFVINPIAGTQQYYRLQQ